jgi:hypothetical protein
MERIAEVRPASLTGVKAAFSGFPQASNPARSAEYSQARFNQRNEKYSRTAVKGGRGGDSNHSKKHEQSQCQDKVFVGVTARGRSRFIVPEVGWEWDGFKDQVIKS